MSTTNAADTFVFSGYQYNWMSVYQPPANSCALTLGASGNSAYVGLVYAPTSSLSVPSGFAFEGAGTGGLIARLITFTGTLPAINYSRSYGPVPPASRLTG